VGGTGGGGDKNYRGMGYGKSVLDAHPASRLCEDAGVNLTSSIFPQKEPRICAKNPILLTTVADTCACTRMSAHYYESVNITSDTPQELYISAKELYIPAKKSPIF